MNRRSFVRKALYVGLGARSRGSKVHNIYQGLSPAAARTIEEKNLGETTAEIDALVARGPFRTDWA